MNATDQARATPVGRLYLDGKLGDLKRERTHDLYQAAVWYAELHRQMRRAIEARDPNVRAPGAYGSGREITAEDCLRALAKHREAERVIPPRSRGAVFVVVVQECQFEDQPEPGVVPEHFIASLIPALEALSTVRLGRRPPDPAPREIPTTSDGA
jgi:hypothetical protein